MATEGQNSASGVVYALLRPRFAALNHAHLGSEENAVSRLVATEAPLVAPES